MLWKKKIIIIIILQASEFDCPLINSFSVSIIFKFCNKLLLLFSYFYPYKRRQKFNEISVLALFLSLVYFYQIKATVLTTILEWWYRQVWRQSCNYNWVGLSKQCEHCPVCHLKEMGCYNFWSKVNMKYFLGGFNLLDEFFKLGNV